MSRWRVGAFGASVVSILLAAAAGGPVTGQPGRQLVVTVRLAGPVQERGAYYVAFTVNDALLAGPQPDSTNWTHYVVYREGRFFFGVVPSATTPQPYGFVVIRPPAPFLFGQVLPDRQALRAAVPLVDLQINPAAPGRVKVNFVIVDDDNRPLDALGPGANDRLGFVTMDLRREVFVTVRDPRGDALDPRYDLVGGEIQLGTP
jgi:hypothetical protein